MNKPLLLRAALCAVALAFALPAMPAFAACDHAAALLKSAYPDAKPGENGLTVGGLKEEGNYARLIVPDSVGCKVWPANPALTLLVVPLTEATPASQDGTNGDVEIIIADSATGKPIARRVETGMAYSDAVQFGDVALDTARYDLKGDLRAFGLRTSQSGSSRVNPYFEDALWLYTYEGGRIRRVLDGLIVMRQNGENNGDCAGDLVTVKRTISLGPAGPTGYRDLVVAQTETDATSAKQGDDCKETDEPGKSRKLVLHFDGKRYVPPAGTKTDIGDPKTDLFSDIMQEETAAPPAASKPAAPKP